MSDPRLAKSRSSRRASCHASRRQRVAAAWAMGTSAVPLLRPDEFGTYRDELRRKLTRPNVEVKIQEDFKALGGDTLTMLEEYIAGCDAVVHFVGEMAGSGPARSSADDLVARNPRLAARLAAKGMPPDALATLAYTQWEAWLAVGFDVDLLIVAPAEGVVRGAGFAPTEASRASQALHLKCLRAINRHPGPPFTNADALVAQIFASAVIDALVKAAAKPIRHPATCRSRRSANCSSGAGRSSTSCAPRF